MDANEQIVALYDQLGENIFRYIYYKTCHRETAEDLTSQTFLKALEKWPLYNSSRGPAAPWLYAIARNLVTDHFRSRGRWGFSSDVMDGWDLPSRDDVLREVTDRETKEELHRALKKLSAAQREVIILRLWEDLPYREIAPLMGKSENSCKMLMSRALKKLKSDLGSSLLYQLLLVRFDFGRSII